MYVSYERGTLVVEGRRECIVYLQCEQSEDSAHVGAIGLALEPLAW